MGMVLFLGGDVIFLMREVEDCASTGDGERESELVLDKGVLGGEVDFSLASKVGSVFILFSSSVSSNMAVVSLLASEGFSFFLKCSEQRPSDPNNL